MVYACSVYSVRPMCSVCRGNVASALVVKASKKTVVMSAMLGSCCGNFASAQKQSLFPKTVFGPMFLDLCFVTCCVLLSCQNVVLARVECWGSVGGEGQAHTFLGQTTSLQCYDNRWTCHRVTNLTASIPTKGWRKNEKRIGSGAGSTPKKGRNDSRATVCKWCCDH